MERSKADKSSILLTIIAVVTLCVAVIGATFAFYSSRVQGNEDAPGISIQTAFLALSYYNGDEILGENVNTNWSSGVKTFTIKNTGNVPATYNIGWVNVVNTFGDEINGVIGKPEELTYTLSCDNGVTLPKTAMPTTPTADIKTNIPINPSEVHTCNIEVTFADTGSNQNYNQGRAFGGKIEVTSNQIATAENE